MRNRRQWLQGGAALALIHAAPAGLLLAPGARAAEAEAEARAAPRLDVPYVPTPMPVVDAMLELARVRKDDLLYDLGCGDGRIVVRAASRFGCRGVGVDLNPDRVDEARDSARQAKVTALARFEVGDVFAFDFSPASVVTMYLLPSVNLKLRPRLLSELRPGTRVVSHDFDMGDWKAQATRDIGRSRLYLWTIPARG
jgi:SAM-dependent methyltransferase